MTEVHLTERRWLTTQQLATALGVSRFTLLREIALGELVATRRRPRGHYRISWDEARRYASRTGVQLAAPPA